MRRARPQRWSMATFALVLLAGMIWASCAHAGQWVQVSCVNPNGSAAPSQGWSTSEVAESAGSSASTECGPGTPMTEVLGSASEPGVGSYVSLDYAPPGGSTIVGGTLQVGLTSTSPYGDEAVYEPAHTYPVDLIALCARLGSAGPISCSSQGDYSGPLALPAGLGGGLFLDAGCGGGSSNGYCAPDAPGDPISEVQVSSADVLLSSSVAPTGAQFGGSALQRNTAGIAHLTFTAGDPGGPGVYSVTAAVDGVTVYSATPNANGGACAAVGTLAGTTALEFDDAQPCLTSEPVDIPIDTTGLSDGRHELAVSVTDAAGNSSTVLDRTITTLNPQRTPAPRRGRRVRAVFRLSYAYRGSRTLVRFVAVSHLPRDAWVTISCTGHGCPRLRPHAAAARHVDRVLDALRRTRYTTGDHLLLIVSAPHHAPERIELRFRSARRPAARLERDRVPRR